MEAGSSGLIGPNAILQLVPVLLERRGADETHALLHQSGLMVLPDGQSMIPEADAARLHQFIRQALPDDATLILREAGTRTADYILAHRIPRLAQLILKLLPAPLAAHLLARAITQHAWTFVGSGEFVAATPWRFLIKHNPLIAGEHAAASLCAWHEAVFERLYRVLVSPHARCREIACGAHHHDGICIFSLTLRPS